MIDFLELLPRIYLESCFLKCYRFLPAPAGSASGEDSVVSAVRRISDAIRGVADPIVASYARAYLMRMAHQGECVVVV